MRYQIIKKHSLSIITAVVSVFLLITLARQYNFIGQTRSNQNKVQKTQKDNQANFNSAATGLSLKNKNRANYHSQINHNDYSIPMIINSQTALQKKVGVNPTSSYKSPNKNTIRTNTGDRVNLD